MSSLSYIRIIQNIHNTEETVLQGEEVTLRYFMRLGSLGKYDKIYVLTTIIRS